VGRRRRRRPADQHRGAPGEVPQRAAGPRVTVTVWDANDPYRYVEARGRVVGEVGGQEARDHIDSESRRYTGRDYGNPIQSERVILRIEPEAIHKNGI
jgi:hypothetical protein